MRDQKQSLAVGCHSIFYALQKREKQVKSGSGCSKLKEKDMCNTVKTIGLERDSAEGN